MTEPDEWFAELLNRVNCEGDVRTATNSYVEIGGRVRAVIPAFFNNTAGENGCERWDANSRALA